MSRATVDLQAVRFFLGYGLIFFTQNLITIVIVAIALVWIDWQLALISFAIAPVLSIAAFRYSRASHPVLKRGAAARRRRHDAGRGEHRRRARREGVRAGAAPARELRRRDRSASSTRRSWPPGSRPGTCRSCRRSPTSRWRRVVLAGGYRVVHGSSAWAQFFAVNGYLLLLVVPLRVDRDVGGAVPARDRLGRADLRGARLRPRHPRPARCGGARAGPRRDPHGGRSVRLRPRLARAGRHRHRRPGRARRWP